MINNIDVVKYAEDGRSWDSERISRPSFDFIKESILRLDRFIYPFVWLNLSEDDESDQMVITGGRGEYHVGIREGTYYFEIFDADRTSKISCVWESDQGFETNEFHLINNAKKVLDIARYYFDHNKRDPSVEWVED